MQTTTINGREIPVPEGCPDFRLNSDGSTLIFLISDRRKSWCKLSLLSSAEQRHAACVAAEWFEHKANTQGLRFGHLMNNGHGDYEIYQECKKAAKAWGKLIDWGGEKGSGSE